MMRTSKSMEAPRQSAASPPELKLEPEPEPVQSYLEKRSD